MSNLIVDLSIDLKASKSSDKMKPKGGHDHVGVMHNLNVGNNNFILDVNLTDG